MIAEAGIKPQSQAPPWLTTAPDDQGKARRYPEGVIEHQPAEKRSVIALKLNERDVCSTSWPAEHRFQGRHDRVRSRLRRRKAEGLKIARRARKSRWIQDEATAAVRVRRSASFDFESINAKST